MKPSTAPANILLAGLFHETNTFLETPATLDEFEILRGDELFTARGNSSPLAGFLAVADAHRWQVHPTVSYTATPSGMVCDDVFENYWREFAAAANGYTDVPLDAIYLVLHGAMVTQSHPDAEGEFLRRLRGLAHLRDVPVFAVVDLHANVTAAMAIHADFISAYQLNPHSDAEASARRAAEFLQRYLVTGQRPRITYRHPPIVLPPTGTATASEPMASLEATARRWEGAVEAILEIAVLAGFSHADTPDSGVAFLVNSIGQSPEIEQALSELVETAEALKTRGTPTEASVAEAFSRTVPGDGPLILVEPADNIGGGAPGDGTVLLRALFQYHVSNAGVIINDPQAVALLSDKTIGAEVDIAIGGKGSSLDPGPYPIRGILRHRSNGNFELEDKQSHLASMGGSSINMGPTLIIDSEGVTIMLTSHKTPPFDLGQWRSQGVEPSKFDVIVVKAAVAHRRAYDRISTRSITVDTPGPCTSNLRLLPYKLLKTPVGGGR